MKAAVLSFALAIIAAATPAMSEETAFPWNVRGGNALKIYTSQTGPGPTNAICTICVDRSTRLFASVRFGGVENTSTIPNRGCAAFATSGNQDIIVRCKLEDGAACPRDRFLEGNFVCHAQ